MYNSDQLPNLYMPIGIGAFLPKKLYYYNIKKNDWARPKLTLDLASNRKPIVSNNLAHGEGHYLSFKFDNNGFVDTVTYLVRHRTHFAHPACRFLALSTIAGERQPKHRLTSTADAPWSLLPGAGFATRAH